MKDYQEALDVLADRELDSVGKMAVNDLQELIDIASRPTIVYGDENTCVINLERIDVLEKALDKACELLQDTEKDSCYYCPIGIKNCVDKDECGNGYCKKEKWKDYLLSEVSK